MYPYIVGRELGRGAHCVVYAGTACHHDFV